MDIKQVFCTCILSLSLLFNAGLGFAQDQGSTVSTQVINAGIGGNSSMDLLGRMEVDVLQKNPDMVLLMIGTNDMVNVAKFTSYPDYRAHIESMVGSLKSKDIEVVLISPIPVDTAYLFERHAREKFDEEPNEKLGKVRMILQDIAREQGLLFIDLHGAFLDMDIPRHNADELIKNLKNSKEADGVHPTPKGYTFMGKFIYEKLQKNKTFLNKPKVIVCFGDSITYGSRVSGAGTAEGDTYPAVLQRLINQSVQLQ